MIFLWFGVGMTSFFCTFWGDKYDKKYVQNLHNAVQRNYAGSFEFYCQTDQKLDIPGVIELPFGRYKPTMDGRFPDKPKLNFWEPNCWGISGRKVYFDLDVVILGNLNKLIDLYDGKPIINRSWWQDEQGINDDPTNYLAYRGITNGSVYIWEDNELTAEMWDHITKNAKYIFFCCINGSDGYFSSVHLDKFDFVPRNMSFSYHNQRPSDPLTYTFCTVDTKRNNAAYHDQDELHSLNGWIKDIWV